MAKPIVLVIRDGWGINPGGKAAREKNGDATLLAQTPFHDRLYREYPCATLSASGEDVGLPAGQMGNSEVGHLNLGAGRIVYQDLTRINKAIADGELERNEVLQEAFAKARNGRLHFIGLVSDGGVHSHYEHLVALAERRQRKRAWSKFSFTRSLTGAIPRRLAEPITWQTCAAGLAKSGARIITVVGRYFAMDRDRRWDRTKLAWDAIVLGRGEVCQDTPSPRSAGITRGEDGRVHAGADLCRA